MMKLTLVTYEKTERPGHRANRVTGSLWGKKGQARINNSNLIDLI